MNKEEIEKIKQYYAITKEDFLKMCMQAREDTFKNHFPNQGKPTAIFIGGQPGAGKSALVIKTKKEFLETQKDIIIFDLDMYRGLYKNSIEIAKKYPNLYSEITRKVAGRILEKMSTEAIQNGYNFIIEGTMGKPVYTLDVLQKSSREYNIIVKTLAVSKEESLLSIHERYIEMKKSMGIGRMTKIENHNSKYDNFTNVVDSIECSGIEVEVYERSNGIEDPKMIYKTSSKNNIYSCANEAIIKGRQNSSRICKNNSSQRLESIKEDIKIFGEEEKYKEQIEKLTSVIEKTMENKEER
ncbi:MAG: zeta toxin family protein [Clostridia bacterium]|nr:zeta toxin family protein [Clostridia bacterium]